MDFFGRADDGRERRCSFDKFSWNLIRHPKKSKKKKSAFFFIADQTTDDGRDGRDETSGSWEGFLSRMQKKDELSSCVCDDEQVAEKRNNLFY